MNLKHWDLFVPENQNQHYVPQFYLRQFSTDGRSISSVLVPSGRLIECASIKGQCSKRNYYRKYNGLDELLSLLESNASYFLKTLTGENTPKVGSSQEFVTECFMLFLATQIHRTPASEDLGKEFDSTFKKMVLARSAPGASLGKDFDNELMDHGSMTRLALHLYPQLCNLDLNLLRAPKSQHFVTSDNPVVLFNRAGELGKVPHSIGAGNSGLMIYYPISPLHSLLFSDPGIYRIETKGRMPVHASHSDVKKLNSLQILNARKAIYAKFSPAELGEQVRSVAAHRTSSRVELKEFMGREVGGKVFARPYVEGVDPQYPTSTYIAFSQKPISSNFTASFLKYRLRPKFEDTGSGAGYIRSRRFFDLAEKYSEAITSGEAKLFNFDTFLKRYLN